MTSESRADRFLQLEATAKDLVEQLDQLHSQVGNYRAASTSLDDAAASLGGLAKSIGDAAVEVARAIDDATKAGVPEVLASLELIHTQLASADSQTQSMRGDMDRLGEQSDLIERGISQAKLIGFIGIGLLVVLSVAAIALALSR